MHLLLIEDDAEAARYLAKGLRESGYAVDIAVDGRDGLFQATERQYDLIIADRQLPHLDGLSIVQMLRKQLGDAYAPLVHLVSSRFVPGAAASLTTRVRDNSETGRRRLLTPGFYGPFEALQAGRKREGGPARRCRQALALGSDPAGRGRQLLDTPRRSQRARSRSRARGVATRRGERAPSTIECGW